MKRATAIGIPTITELAFRWTNWLVIKRVTSRRLNLSGRSSTSRRRIWINKCILARAKPRFVWRHFESYEFMGSWKGYFIVSLSNSLCNVNKRAEIRYQVVEFWFADEGLKSGLKYWYIYTDVNFHLRF